jgi:hypothetical protein
LYFAAVKRLKISSFTTSVSLPGCIQTPEFFIRLVAERFSWDKKGFFLAGPCFLGAYGQSVPEKPPRGREIARYPPL